MKKIIISIIILFGLFCVAIYFVFSNDGIVMKMGDSFSRKGEVELANKAYSLIISRARSKAVKSKAYVHLGMVAYQQNKSNASLVLSKKALDLDRNNAEAYNLAAVSIIKMGDYNSAIQFIQKAVTLDPSNINYKELLGYALSANGQYDEATKVFNEILPKITDLNRISDIQKRISDIRELNSKKTDIRSF